MRHYPGNEINAMETPQADEWFVCRSTRCGFDRRSRASIHDRTIEVTNMTKRKKAPALPSYAWPRPFHEAPTSMRKTPEDRFRSESLKSLRRTASLTTRAMMATALGASFPQGG